jgi:hypothetical protein
MRTPIVRCAVARIYNCGAREESSRTASVGSGAHPGKSERSGGRAARHAQTDPATLAPTRDRRRYTRPPEAPGGSLAAATLRTAPRRPGRPPDTRSGAAGGRGAMPRSASRARRSGCEQGHPRQDRPQRLHIASSSASREPIRPAQSPWAPLRKTPGPPHPSAGSRVPTPVPCKDAAALPAEGIHRDPNFKPYREGAGFGRMCPSVQRGRSGPSSPGAASAEWSARTCTWWPTSSLRGRGPQGSGRSPADRRARDWGRR